MEEEAMITDFHTAAFDTPEQREAVSQLPNIERQRLIEHLLVTYPQFDKLVEFISNYHYPVVGGSHGRGSVGGLIGKTRAGKSDIIKFYCNRWPAYDAEDGSVIPVVYIPVPPDIVAQRFAEIVYGVTGPGSAPKIKLPSLMGRSVDRIVGVRAQLVVIDDSQFLFQAPKNHLREFYGFLKLLADTESCNILFVGEESVITSVLAFDPLAERGGFPKEVLKPFDRDTEFDQFRLMLHEIDLRLPFAELSGLATRYLAAELHDFTGGAMGKVMKNLVRPAAFRALNDGSPRILRHHFYEEAALRQRPGDTRVYFASEAA
ncbi:TniB family NTP-binding protein [Sinorhizobium fredii]|uniref:TniB family NTP-binding protein n=1 Tax=Rhizobium fredii TaxID=380 RepID=UPI003514886D